MLVYPLQNEGPLYGWQFSPQLLLPKLKAPSPVSISSCLEIDLRNCLTRSLVFWVYRNARLSVVSCQLSVVSCQLSVVSCQLSVVSCQLSVVRKMKCLMYKFNFQSLITNLHLKFQHSQFSTIDFFCHQIQ